jgi:hypothetical protein
MPFKANGILPKRAKANVLRDSTFINHSNGARRVAKLRWRIVWRNGGPVK